MKQLPCNKGAVEENTRNDDDGGRDGGIRRRE
jgi:hypothetical protein